MLSGIDAPKLEFITELCCGIHQFASKTVMVMVRFRKSNLWLETKMNECLYTLKISSIHEEIFCPLQFLWMILQESLKKAYSVLFLVLLPTLSPPWSCNP